MKTYNGCPKHVQEQADSCLQKEYTTLSRLNSREEVTQKMTAGANHTIRKTMIGV